jgi:hypothetical protein
MMRQMTAEPTRPSGGRNFCSPQSVEILETQMERLMATNAPAGDNHRNGAVRKRSQLKTKVMGEEHYTKRSKKSGQFMEQKKDDGKFKGVRKEKSH